MPSSLAVSANSIDGALAGVTDDDLNQHDSALADYDLGLELDPDCYALLNNRGHCYSLQKDFARAIPDYNRSIELNPGCGMAYYNRGLAWYHFDEYNKALADYTRALEVDLPSGKLASLHNNLGHVLLMKDRHAESILAYSKAIALDIGNASYYVNRAEVHEYDGHDDLAADDYTRAIALEHGNADLYMSRCAAQIRCKRFLAALADFWRGVRIILRT